MKSPSLLAVPAYAFITALLACGGGAATLGRAQSQAGFDPHKAASTLDHTTEPSDQKFERSLYAHEFAGSDAGAKINACLAALPTTGAAGGVCDASGLTGAQAAAATIVIPPYCTLRLGAVNLTTSAAPGIQVEPGTSGPSLGSAAALVGQGSATIISYTGSGDAILAYNPAGVGQFNARVRLADFQIEGTAAGEAGVKSETFQFGSYERVTVGGFSNGSAFLNDGASSVHCIDCSAVVNKYGWHDVDDGTFGVPTNNLFLSGQIQQSSSWGFYEDSTNSGAGFSPPISNGVIGATFTTNGAPGGAGGDAFIQACDGCFLLNNYEEQQTSPGPSLTHIQLGDAGHSAVGTNISGNTWLTPATGLHAAFHDVLLVNSLAASISGNLEEGETGAMVYDVNGASRGTIITNDCGLNADEIFSSTTSNVNTLVLGGCSAGPAPNQNNMKRSQK